jgi:hypothetical protein
MMDSLVDYNIKKRERLSTTGLERGEREREKRGFLVGSSYTRERLCHYRFIDSMH